jgi:hypothetical protein
MTNFKSHAKMFATANQVKIQAGATLSFYTGSTKRLFFSVNFLRCFRYTGGGFIVTIPIRFI